MLVFVEKTVVWLFLKPEEHYYISTDLQTKDIECKYGASVRSETWYFIRILAV